MTYSLPCPADAGYQLPAPPSAVELRRHYLAFIEPMTYSLPCPADAGYQLPAPPSAVELQRQIFLNIYCACF